MKITNVASYALEQKLEKKDQFAFSQAWCDKRTVFICKIETDEGITGWGEAFGPSLIHKTIVDKFYRDYLIGKNPFDSQVIWETLHNKFRDNGQKGVTVQALSAVDIALWDIKGKAADVPVYQLMGGRFRDRLKAYATGMYRKYTPNEIEETAAEAASYVERGFRAVKVKTGFGFDYDYAVIKAVREAIGDDINMMIDANHGYNASTAIKIGRAVEKFDITWYEEPVPPEDLEGYKEVKASLNIPIAGGEAEFTRWGLNDFIRYRCADYVQADCTITGGLSEFMRVGLLCSIANIQCMPHIWGSSIALATGINAAFSVPDFPPGLEPADVYLEYDQTENIFREELASPKPIVKDGWLYPSEKPGLGIEVNEDLIKHYAVE
ncbi:MAG: mandelate racemase/muconate lactonizing enzyme family protein [Spirochaetales bacterium]|uniref:Mandelate racemase/muconate lactonizing enzyme family protein n=1 Tax=Candidatus Thalassospirochaeta sargassi TaxID=3119039 RepID=A0AAJ1II98_9SPIO|nr:mandelate racemase/muconate lactonizing enzyme family protein [Spirochaetales bacterium]